MQNVAQNTKPVAARLLLGFHPKSSTRNHRPFDESAPLWSEILYPFPPPMNGNLLTKYSVLGKKEVKAWICNPLDLGPLQDSFTRRTEHDQSITCDRGACLQIRVQSDYSVDTLNKEN